MPNHITNILEFHGDQRKIREMLDNIKYDDVDSGSIDFEKIIPMPKSLKIEAGSTTERGLKAYTGFVEIYLLGRNRSDVDLLNIPKESEEVFLRVRKDIDESIWELGKTAFQNIQRYGADTWYDWSIANWGTKWNSYGYEEGEDHNQNNNTIWFQTAWAAPHPVISKLAEMYPEIEISHEWADEDIGENCGRFEYKNGERCIQYFPETDKEKIEFAAKVMDTTPEDYGLQLNAKGTGYVSVENRSYQLVEVFGKPVLFTKDRITNEDIPKGLFCYHLRRLDDDIIFTTIESKVMTHHTGSVITDEAVDLGEQGYLSFSKDDVPTFIDSSDLTILEYMNGEFEPNVPKEGMDMIL